MNFACERRNIGPPRSGDNQESYKEPCDRSGFFMSLNKRLNLRDERIGSAKLSMFVSMLVPHRPFCLVCGFWTAAWM